MTSGAGPRIGRRALLQAGVGGLVLVALDGCGSSGGASDGDTTTDTTADGLSVPLTFLGDQPVDVPVRLPLALADGEGALLSDPPASIAVAVGLVGATLGTPISIDRHDDGIPGAYYPLTTSFDQAGSWRIVVDALGTSAELTIEALPATQLPAVPAAGDPMVSVTTPTTEDHRGVEPICTAEPICRLHDTSLDVALTEGRPVVVLVSTPRYCQVTICGPVLDLLLEQADARADQARFVHLEVYRDGADLQLAPAIEALGLTYEPALFVVGADGVVRDRLDLTYDRRELDTTLARTLG